MAFNAEGDAIFTSSLVKYKLDERWVTNQVNNCTKTNINQWLSFKKKDAEWGSAESTLDKILFSTFI